jgi:hypothetical protein
MENILCLRDFFLLKIQLEIRIIIILSVTVAVHLDDFVSLSEFPLNSMLECIHFLKSGNSFQKVNVFCPNYNHDVTCFSSYG